MQSDGEASFADPVLHIFDLLPVEPLFAPRSVERHA